MSSEPIASGAASSEAPADEPGQDSEVAQVLHALGRLDATIRGEREILARLRGALHDMAGLLDHARQSMRAGANAPLDVGMLLDELEHRVDTMIGLGGGSAPTRPQEVPTVSGVVSQLGRGDDAPRPTAPPQGPTVSELTAMVQALSAAVTATPEADEAASPPATEAAADASLGSEPDANATPVPDPEGEDLSAFLFGSDLPELTGDWKRPDAGPTPALPAVDLMEESGAPVSDQGATHAASANVDAADNAASQSPAGAKTGADPNDPLAPIKAMSEWERLALFS